MATQHISLGRARIIDIAMAMGFKLDLCKWKDSGWIRFVLGDSELRDDNLILIWYKEQSIETNLLRASRILFRAGQKAKVLQFTNEYKGL